MEILRVWGSLFLRDTEFNQDLDRAERRAEQASRNIDNTFRTLGSSLGNVGAAITNNINNPLNATNGQLVGIYGTLNRAGQNAGGSSGAFQRLGKSLIGVGSAVTKYVNGPLAALGVATAAGGPLVAGAAALGASFMAAGAGVAAFGAVAVSNLTKVFTAAEEVAKIEEKIASADTAKEKLAAQKELAEYYKTMSAAQREALMELQSFKKFWGDFTKQFEEPVFAIFAGGLELVKSIMEPMAPTIHAISDTFIELMGEMNRGIDAGGLKNFFGWLESNAAPAIYNFSHIAGNLFKGVWNVIASFSPVGAEMEEGLLRLTERFANWSTTLASSTAFQNFISYIQTNGPILLGIIGSVLNMLGQLLPVVAPLGAALMQGLGQALQMITPVILNLAQTIVPMLMQSFQQVFPIIMQVVQAVLPVITNLINQLLPIIMEVAQLAIPLILQAVQMVFPVVMQIIQSVIPVIIELVKLAAVIFKTILIPAIKDLLPIVQAVLPAIQRIIQVAMTVIGNIVKAISAALQGDWKGAWNAMKAAGQAILNAILSSIRSMFNSIKEAIMTPIRAAVSFVGEQIAKLKGFFSGLKLDLPKIKLPHFKISGEFSLKPPSVPKIGVDWYAKGGVFAPNSPQVIGIGDHPSAPEAAIPLTPSVLGQIGAAIAKYSPSQESKRGNTHVTVNARTVDMNENDLLRALQRVEVLYGR